LGQLRLSLNLRLSLRLGLGLRLCLRLDLRLRMCLRLCLKLCEAGSCVCVQGRLSIDGSLSDQVCWILGLQGRLRCLVLLLLRHSLHLRCLDCRLRCRGGLRSRAHARRRRGHSTHGWLRRSGSRRYLWCKTQSRGSPLIRIWQASKSWKT